jgi:hypothetical protein
MDDETFIKRFFINTYLDAPIIEGEAIKGVAALTLEQAGQPNSSLQGRVARSIIKKLDREKLEFQVYDPYDLAHLLAELPTKGAKLYMTEAHKLARSIFDGVTATLTEITQGAVPVIPFEESSRHSREYLNRAELFVRYCDALSCSRAAGGKNVVQQSFGGHTLTGNQYYVVWTRDTDDLADVLPYEAVMMFKDMCLSRSNVFEGIRVMYTEVPEMENKVISAFDWCASCLTTYGNRGYEILKNIESITKAYIIDRCDPVFRGRGVLQRLLVLVRQKEDRFGNEEGLYIIDKLVDLLQSCSSLDTVTQIFGLQKLTGHPLINPKIGGESAAHEASLPRDTLYTDAVELRNNWRRLYLEGFIRKNQRWPDLAFSPEAKSTTLYQLYSMRELKITRHSYNISDWNHVRFKRHLEFEYFDNFLDLMDDKSISFYLSEFRATWRRDVRPRSHRRLLLEMLSRSDVSIKAIVELVEKGDVPSDWLIVSLYPKEREFKLEARMFSMMVFEMRAFFACLEANLADKVYPYMPQQTMTLSKTEILARFLALTKPSLDLSVIRLFLEVDLSRWNLRWRDLPVRLIGEDLNDMFGLQRSYTFVHQFFKNSMILVRVAGYEPEGLDLNPPPQSSLLWYNHEGGFEGIAQKHWTLATYSMIDLGVKNFDFNYTLMGQGDNQVILAHLDMSAAVDKDEATRTLASRITESISDACSKVGQDAKPEECLESTVVITYSKDIFIAGAEYYLTLKSISRLFPRGTSEFPTVLNCVGAIGAGSVAAAERMKDPIRGYYLMLFLAARYLLSLRTRVTVESMCLTKRGRMSFTVEAVRGLLLLPSTLGGLPLPTSVSFLYKGGSDPLTKDLSSLRLLAVSDRLVLERCLSSILDFRWTRLDHNPASILSDPYSIPISTVPLAESRVQTISLQHVMHATSRGGNQDIREIVSADIATFEDELVSSLLHVTPFNPAFLADVLGLSIVGVKEMISRMFTSTRTVQTLTQGDESDPGGMILRSSASTITDVLARLSTIGRKRHRVESCYATAVKLRNLWSKLDDSPIPSIEGVTNYMPLEWEIRVKNRPSRGDEIQVIFTGGLKADRSSGPYEPYLGRATKEKRSRYGYKIVVSSSAERAASSLYNIMTQPGVDPTFERMVTTMAGTRTNTDLSRLKDISSKAVGGTIGHRYTSTFDINSASVLGCSTFASYIVLQSNYAGQLSGSLVDHPVMFQEFDVAGIGLLNYRYQRGVSSSVTLGFVVPKQLVELPDQDTTAPFHHYSIVPQLIGNKIAFCDDLRLIRQERPYSTHLIGPLMGNSAVLPPGSLVRSAAAREMRRHSTAHSIADTSSGSIRLTLDVLEYRGVGMSNVIAGVSQAITDHLYHTLFSRVNSGWRWTAMPLIKSLSSAFSHSIVRVATHPMFRDDAFVLSVIRPSEVRYSYYRAVERVTRVLATEAHAHYVKRPSMFGSAKRLLFIDDEESSSLEVTIMTFRKGLVTATMASEISADQAMTIDKTVLLQRLRGALTPELRLQSVYGAALVMHDYCLKNKLLDTEKYFREFLDGNLVGLVDGTLVELLRLRRRYDLTLRYTAPLDSIPGTAGPEPCSLTFPLETHTQVNLTLSDGYKSGTEWKRFLFRRTRSREYGLDAPAVHSFHPARRALRSSTLLILGSGNGGCAAVAGHMRVERIILHDKQSDIQPEQWAAPDVVLPAIQRFKKHSYYERSLAGYNSVGGNIEEECTWEDLTRLSPVGTCIVYDIAITSVENLTWLIGRVSLHFPGCPLILRWIVGLHQAQTIISSLHASFKDLEVYVVFIDTIGIELITRMTVHPGDTLKPFTQTVLLVPLFTALCSDQGIDTYGGSRIINWSDEFSEFDGDVGEEEHLISQSGVSIVDDALRKSNHGYTYGQWTRVLWYLYAKNLKNDPGTEEERYIAAIERGDATVSLRGHVINLAVTKAFKNFLSRILPRCM